MNFIASILECRAHAQIHQVNWGLHLKKYKLVFLTKFQI